MNPAAGRSPTRSHPVHTAFTTTEPSGNGLGVRSAAMDRSAPGDRLRTTPDPSTPADGDRSRRDLDPLDPPIDERLTARERAVYEVLLEHRGRVLGRHEIARLAGLSVGNARRCDAVIVGVRRVIGEHRIRTVRRRGWVLDG